MAAPQTKQLVRAEIQGLRPVGSLYTFEELYRMAQLCHESGLFEDLGDAAQGMIKIVRGQEMGFPPMAAMQAFDIIKKRLFIKPWAIAARINASGYGSYKVLEQTPEQCTILFRRKYHGSGWDELPPVTYTFAEARAHGLVDRSPHWKASPAHMLYQRCMGRGGAMHFPELLAGLTPPPDDTPVPPERHQQNIIDLFGESVTSSTGQKTAQDAPESTNAPQQDLGVGQGTQKAPPGSQGTPEALWRETIHAHLGELRHLFHARDTDAEANDNLETQRLAQLILEVQAALEDPSFPDGRGHLLADAVLDWTNLGA